MQLTTAVIFGFIINGKIIRVVVVLKGLQCGDIRQKVGKKLLRESRAKIQESGLKNISLKSLLLAPDSLL